jgi:hypothetical protein
MLSRAFIQLGVAGLLLFIGVCLGSRTQPQREGPLTFVGRMGTFALAAVFFFSFVAQSVGFDFSVDRAADWLVDAARRLVEVSKSRV